MGLAILAPIGLLNPIIFNRYLIGTLPLVLLGVAAGLDRVIERDRRLSPPRGAASLAPAVLIAMLVARPDRSPMAPSGVRRSSTARTSSASTSLAASWPPTAVPPFYPTRPCARRRVPIIEFPFRGGWSATRAHYVYQSIHRAPVLAAEPYGWPCDERLRLRNHVCSRPATLLASPARYLVVHRDPLAEESLVVGGDDTGNRYQPAGMGGVRADRRTDGAGPASSLGPAVVSRRPHHGVGPR